MRHPLSWLSIVLVNCLLPIGILIFAKGFFPYKPYLHGFATFESGIAPAPPRFDKLIFMVVDALRSDFVFSDQSNFKFTQKLISSGHARPFTAYATPPTITMPRVKAITTGSVPGFLDLILNFAESDTTSTLAQQDTWLAQLKAYRGNIVMYGDDTWLKLFPGVFHRSEGTSSFFVSDFTEVDHNVTRHIDYELANDEWSAMVMHYLGMDHIGHKAGPGSKHMLPKQAEMDLIVERIYTAIESRDHLKSTLFVLLGDHGMNDAGNHGGSGTGETSPALVFMSPKFKKLPGVIKSPTQPHTDHGFDFYSTVQQSDIAPSLSGLFGIPIPKNNLGVFISEFLHLWDERDRVEILFNNAKQLCSIVINTYPKFGQHTGNCISTASDLEELQCLWARSLSVYEEWRRDDNLTDDVINLLQLSILSGVASAYDLRWMASGIAVIAIASVAASFMLFPLLKESLLVARVYPVISLVYGITMFASSYVEEEHNFWYWIAAGWFMVLFFKENNSQKRGYGAILIMIFLRTARRWNQTGQKYAGAADIARHYFPDHKDLLWILIVLTYVDIFLRLSKYSFRRIGIRRIGTIFTLLEVAAGFVFKISFAAQDAPELIPHWLYPIVDAISHISLVSQARAVFSLLLTGIIYTCMFESSRSASKTKQNTAVAISNFINLFLITQSRFTNLPLFLLLRIVEKLLYSFFTLSSQEISFTILLLQHFSFFAFGGTNAISSVDLSNAYNGVAGYNVLIVGSLTLISNWAAPLFWTSITPALLVHYAPKDHQSWRRHLLLLTTFYIVTTSFVMSACTTLRTHLFIWTVFSPKYLYNIVWTVLFHIFMSLGWGSVMMWIAGLGDASYS